MKKIKHKIKLYLIVLKKLLIVIYHAIDYGFTYLKYKIRRKT